MATYVVTLKATGQEVYRYSAESPIEWQGMEFATHDHTALPAEPTEPVSPPSVYGGRRVLTIREFYRLFSDQERVTVWAAMKGNVALEDFYRVLTADPDVHLDDPAMPVGLGFLEQSGILGAGRAAEILNG